MLNKQGVLDYLTAQGVPYQLAEHQPVFTIDEMLAAGLPFPDTVAKNLFVRDDKKRNYYLITVREEKRVDLKEFQARFGTRKLSFGSEEDLMKYLGLKKGSVSPFGLLNDETHSVQFYLDEDFLAGDLGIHPNDNTATVWLSATALLRLLQEIGCSCQVFSL